MNQCDCGQENCERMLAECECARISWDPQRTTEPYYKSCECQYRDDVKVVNLNGAGLMLVAR